MTDKKLRELLSGNIRQALEDYRAHTYSTTVLDDVSEEFIEKLAADAVVSKSELRELLRKSPVWDEDLQALVINGTRTHDTDFSRVCSLAREIFKTWTEDKSYEERILLLDAMRYFTEPEASKYQCKCYINAINEIAPKAYRPNRKKSRIFKSICDALGVTDESAGSDFQKLFAKLADELNGKKIDFKLFLSINPAHFLTMSNPKNDARGNTLTSCHSFNSVEYQYNCGCSGYARDNVTMIAFTVADPENPETLNNRKTTRQLFMYKVGNGLLLQSRMYNTSGGVYGASELTPIYRHLVEYELSELERVPNLWKMYTYCKNRPDNVDIKSGYGFGGYPDWVHDFDAKISIRADHQHDFKNFTVGTYGLCIKCGEEIDEGLYCHQCNHKVKCECCNEYFDEYELNAVHDMNGDEIMVCDCCRDDNYGWCECCEENYPLSSMVRTVDDELICEGCLGDHYYECDDCGEYCRRENVIAVYDVYGNEAYVCESCFENNYAYCDGCEEYHHHDSMMSVVDENGEEKLLCEDCRDGEYETCDDCCRYYHKDLLKDGLCPKCRANYEEELA